MMFERISRRRLLRACVATASTSAVLLGCSQSTLAPPVPQPASGSTSRAVSEASQAPAAKQGAIQFWHWGPSYVDGFTRLVNEYNATNPPAQVERSLPAGYWEKLVTTQAGGTAPDVFLMASYHSKEYAHSGRVHDLSDLVGRDKVAAADLAGTLQAEQGWYHYGGKLMGLPWDYSAGVVVYNLDHLREVGLKPPAELGAAWTWQTFRDYATRLTQRSGDQITRSGAWVTTGLENGWYTFAVANGASMFSDDLRRCTIASEAATQALDYLQGMLKDGVIAPPAFQQAVNKQVTSVRGGEFLGGHTSMILTGDWLFTWYRKGDKSVRWDATGAPRSPTGQTANTANMRGTVLDPASKHTTAAVAFMTFLLKRSVQDRIPSLMGEIPALDASRDAVYLDPAQAGPPASRATFKPELAATTPLPSSDRITWVEETGIVDKSIAAVFALQQNPGNALKQVQAQVQSKIDATK